MLYIDKFENAQPFQKFEVENNQTIMMLPESGTCTICDEQETPFLHIETNESICSESCMKMYLDEKALAVSEND